MAEFKGEVAFLDPRNGTSKKPPYRPYRAYSIKLKLENGEFSPRIDGGFLKPGEEPPCSKGDYVAVTTKQNGQYETIDTIAKVARPVAVPAANAAGGERANTGGAAEEAGGAADRQTQIVLQHSQEMALQAVALLIERDALPLSSATNKSGAAKRYEEIRKAVQKLTVEFFFDVVTGRLLESVADAGEVIVEDVGELPPAANDAKAAAGAATGTDD